MRRQTPLRPGRPPHGRIIIYWKMCRTCHRIGTRALSPVDRCTHPVEAVGICGQCGKKRPLVTCHRYDFRGLRSGTPHRTTAIRRQNRKRKASKFARAYGSAERVEFVRSLSCAGCGYSGPLGWIDNAHTTSGGRGRKADYATIIPLCRATFDRRVGCHNLQHEKGWSALPALDTPEKRETAAARTEELWQSHLRQTGRARQETDSNG